MDLIIQNATLEEITTICSRVAEPSFNEMTDDKRLEEITQYMLKGDSAAEAKYKWQESMIDRAEATLNKDDDTKTITREEIKKEMGMNFEKPSQPEVKVETELKQIKGSEDGGLHLDGPPPDDTPPELAKVTKKDVVRMAGKLSQSGKRDEVKRIVSEFGVTRIIDLDEADYKAAYDKLAEAV